MKLKVQATFLVSVEVSDDIGDVFFHIEENNCPGTGEVGAAIERAIRDHNEKNTCWGCALHGRNRILAIDGKEVGK